MVCLYKVFSGVAAFCLSLIQCAAPSPIPGPSDQNTSGTKRSQHKRSATVTEFHMDEESRQKMVSGDSVCGQEDTAKTSRAVFDNKLVCPTTVSTDMNDPDHKRSTCPWYYEVDHDAKRFPSAVINAKRLCNYCIGSNQLLECVPITQTVSGLRQRETLDGNGNYVWTEEPITTTVGFTCAGRRMGNNAATDAPPPTQAPDEDDAPWAK